MFARQQKRLEGGRSIESPSESVGIMVKANKRDMKDAKRFMVYKNWERIGLSLMLFITWGYCGYVCAVNAFLLFSVFCFHVVVFYDEETETTSPSSGHL